MRYDNPPLILADDFVTDALGTIRLTDLPDPQPAHPLRLCETTPLMERLWRIALADVESNLVETESGRYFGAGTQFGATVYTRDISYSGVLGLNRLFPEIMRDSLAFSRRVRFDLGFTVPKAYVVEDLDAPWVVEEGTESDFMARHTTNNLMRRTDDVVWLWAAHDLVLAAGNRLDDWRWMYEAGKESFETLYRPLFDEEDGLYRGQASFVDIHFEGGKTTGYPQDYTIGDCVLLKALSTNCLYVLAMEAMSEAAKRLNRAQAGHAWHNRADTLRLAIRNELGNPDGSLAYFKDTDDKLEPRRDALGSALAILAEVVEGEEARRVLAGYPVTDAGVPLFHPFFADDTFYHNNASWPFVDSLFLLALEKATGEDQTARQAALLARTCRGDGTFHEVVDFRDKAIRGSGSQLWSAAGFLGLCLRAGLKTEG